MGWLPAPWCRRTKCGYYRTGDTIAANFHAKRLDEKAVEGTGVLTLYKITYKGGTGNDVVLNAVPEPSTALLVGLGLTGLAAARKRSILG